MIDDAAGYLEQKTREQREADLVASRIGELYEKPLDGQFDIAHLRAIHAYIFQDLPEHQPGVIRERTEIVWVKHRVLEGQTDGYNVYYARDGIEAKIIAALDGFGGSRALIGETLEGVASRISTLYGDLDHAHGFYEGNSRTLREFTRELALAAGYKLDWIKTHITAKERNELYVARDVAVLERVYPGLDEERAMQTNDRAEYEAWFSLARLRQAMGHRSLTAIIRDGLSHGAEIQTAPPDDANDG